MTITTDLDLTEILHTQMPLSYLNRLDAVEATIDRVVMAAEWQPESCGIGGILHGC